MKKDVAGKGPALANKPSPILQAPMDEARRKHVSRARDLPFSSIANVPWLSWSEGKL